MAFKETGTKVTWANPQVVPENKRENGGWYYNPATGSVDRWWSDGGDLATEAKNRSEDMVADEIYNYLDKINKVVGLTLSDQEIESFLQKATEQVTPYYDKRLAEINAGINEGKIQDAEDLLLELRRSKEEMDVQLRKFDIQQAQTEEEFVNTLAEITSQAGEDLEVSKLNWTDRVNQARTQQVQKGIQTSGIGQQETNVLNQRAGLEQTGIERRAQEKQTSLETTKKYTVESIALAREAVEKERIRKYGTADDAAKLETDLKQRAGVTDDYSEIGLLSERARRNISAYKPEALTQTEEEKKRAIESRKLQLQEEELAAKKTTQASQVREMAAKNPNLLNYGSI